MISPAWLVAAFVGVSALLALLVARRPGLASARGGKVLAFLALFLFPALAVTAGFSVQMERATSTKFCLSCHVMHDYGRSLWIDDRSYLAAAHVQNNRVPRDRACYTCHTDYAMFGTVRAKVRGLRHLYIQYLGKVPAPDQIKLYEPFHNRECLHCHDGGRKYLEQPAHNRTPDQMNRILSNQLSCTSSRCHDTVHDVGSLSDVTFWKGEPKP